MSLPLPNLDDRDFRQLVAEARRRIEQTCPEWTDRSPSDPGMVLVDVFAYLTDTMLYRLNRLPEKAYVAFLRLLGVRLQPPSAASVTLTFSRARAGERPLSIPQGTRVTVGRSTGSEEPPVFATSRQVVIEAGATEVEVLAYHADVVQAELVGGGTGLPGLSFNVRQPPIVAPTGDELDLVVGVEALPDELSERVPAVQHDEKSYEIWQEATNFTGTTSGSGGQRRVYVADRMSGTISFAPALRLARDEGLEEAPVALADVPMAGREIRVWYRRGGGSRGNVAVGTLTTLRDSIPGVEVTNHAPATGGREAEQLDNALLRGPQQLHSLERAVTAPDFEHVALTSSRAVVRARAFTRAALWTYAAPGTVEILLVPYLGEESEYGGRASVEALQERHVEEARSQIQSALDLRRPLGTTCIVGWARYKVMRVSARIVVRREEDQAAVKRRVEERLHLTINPLPTRLNSIGWRFGEALRASHVYDIALAEPGVRWVDRVRLIVDEVPEGVITTLVPDAFQARTWYAGSGATLYRSLNGGDSWEPAGRFGDQEVFRVQSHPQRAGMLAAATRPPSGGVSQLHVSYDCGESWQLAAQTDFEIEDLAWMLRDDEPVILLATDVGLYELTPRDGATPVQVLVDPDNPSMGFYSVAVYIDVRGEVGVAVAAQQTVGVYLSSDQGRSGTFRVIGLDGSDIRVLAIQYDGPRSFLWAGTTVAGGDDPGQGCLRWELRGAADPPEGWRSFDQGWVGGSCRGLAFLGGQVLAASFSGGVLRLNPNSSAPNWQAPEVRCGLPLRDRGRFHPVNAVGVDPGERLVIAGTNEGVYRSANEGDEYSSASQHEFDDMVALPETWLFCSGEHAVEVVSEDEAQRD